MDSSMELTKSSVRRIEANRRNAQYSTGPRTATGKQAVKWNALFVPSIGRGTLHIRAACLSVLAWAARAADPTRPPREIGRASCRERV